MKMPIGLKRDGIYTVTGTVVHSQTGENKVLSNLIHLSNLIADQSKYLKAEEYLD